ncbi:MAG: hypothetical protein HQL49_12220, partial [Gammaproteobacteria bacterium]|nr:hypothetical protein [Gammaproteobacteria bacterium]
MFRKALPVMTVSTLCLSLISCGGGDSSSTPSTTISSESTPPSKNLTTVAAKASSATVTKSVLGAKVTLSGALLEGTQKNQKRDHLKSGSMAARQSQDYDIPCDYGGSMLLSMSDDGSEMTVVASGCDSGNDWSDGPMIIISTNNGETGSIQLGDADHQLEEGSDYRNITYG